MSLYERVRQAGNAQQSSAPDEGDLLNRLRGQLQEEVSVDKLARLFQENPDHARNEVVSACRGIFEGPSWDYIADDTRGRLVAKLLDSIFGFGELEDLLCDEAITEVMVNGPGTVLYERDGKISPTGRHFAGEAELRSLIDRILGPLGRRIDEASPMVDARLPQGHRVNIVVPPVALDGPYVTIRKFSEHVITLEEMEASGSVEEPVGQLLRWAVLARKSMAVSGGTGSGKTTLLNALSCVIPADERIVTIEDSAELRFFEHPDVVRLEARPENAEGTGEVTIRQLVMNALRMRPDRIVVGECRGFEALDMLQAMNTGHDGSLTTLHANSPEESVSRLATMVRFGADLPIDVIEANIANAIHLVVQTERALDGTRRVSEVVRFSFDRSSGRCRTHRLYQRPLGSGQGAWEDEPPWLAELAVRGIATAEEVDAWRRRCSLC